ncbi:MAG: 2-oxoglutarate dehydrogenase E1 component, partial [Rhodospirillaceae bacterium]
MAQQLEQTSFLAGANGAFIEELYGRYLKDPASVDSSWRAFFAELNDEAPAVLKSLEGASWAPRTAHVIANGNGAAVAAKPAAAAAPVNGDMRTAVTDSIHALMLIRAYRVRGHLLANLDPLGIDPIEEHPELDPATYGFAEADYDREIFIDNVLGYERATLRQIITRLRETYAGSIGVEYTHIQDPDEKNWIQERIESVHNRTEFTERGKLAILERLTQAETFERFLHVKYPGTKRFGLDGGEALIPALEQIIKRGSQLGVEEAVIGMPHRGRLNVLANFMSKPFAQIFTEFQGADLSEVQGSGDVKYHLGTSADREFDGKTVHLSLNPNPSHLEAVNPVVVGKVRAKQRQLRDSERRRVMGLLMHGDAAFSGQGLVAETLAISDIKGYRSGGTIHIVVNNQIGFTTNPQATRTSRYPTEVAKMIQAPIFHVNGDDVEAVVHVARIATEFRHEFRRDVVLDIWCYRRYGHNEGDEPGFTQPVMYKAIAKQPTTREIYARQLVAEGVVSEADAQALVDEARARLDHDYAAASTYKPNKADWLEGQWSGLNVAPSPEERRGKTDVSVDFLREVGHAMTRVPDGFSINPKAQRILDQRREAIDTGHGIDWSTAEALAFGTLVAEGTFVRLSGQDCGRGTFSQRHAVLVDQENQGRYVPLANVKDGQARFIVLDSPLSEAAILGYEYGYSLAEPNALIMWEAQFGDFANGAQVIFDQFIASSESKWLRMSGLVMLLP